MIIVSNGHHKFITGMAAAEASRRGLLSGFITAGYPEPAMRRWITRFGLDRYASVKRLLQRQEDLPDELAHPLWLSQAIYSAARVIAMRFPRFEDISDLGMQCYAWQAERIVAELQGRIYHYRSGYGRASVQKAKEKGMIALCDHSIAHPQVLDYLVSNQGQLPPSGYRASLGRTWRNVLEDIDRADHVLVNSDFVRETFIRCGHDPQRISVLYTGVDDRFLSAVPLRSPTPPAKQPMRLLFAGELGLRKGGRMLLQALMRLGGLQWEFVAVGNIDPELRSEFAALFADRRVSVRGHLAWPELAREMSMADIFVFPSLAEGSARVVFMAMACGCHVITTPNSGSVVQDGVHGKLVEPGNVDALAAALHESLHDVDFVRAAGRRSAELIREHYTQHHYGEGLMELYEMLADIPAKQEPENGF